MNPQDIFNLLKEIFYWRSAVCFFVGCALAIVVEERIAAEPLNRIIAGVIVAVSLYLGWRWDRSH